MRLHEIHTFYANERTREKEKVQNWQTLEKYLCKFDDVGQWCKYDKRRNDKVSKNLG